MSLDIETGIETFEIMVLISRLVSRLKKQGGIPVIETLASLMLISGPFPMEEAAGSLAFLGKRKGGNDGICSMCQ